MSFFSEQVQQKNQALYNAFPYPGYPFFFRPHIPSAYPGASWFAKSLAGYSNDPTGRVAVLGCGDTQPYVMRQLEHPQTTISCVDVAEKPLSLAKRRCFRSHSSMDFVHRDLINYLKKQKNNSLSHIDAFGVLHHLSDPYEAIFLMNQKLASHGTIRLMIYNSKAREWIKWVQKLAKLSGIEGDHKASTRDFLFFVERLSEHIPFLKTKLSSIPLKTSQMPRLVDAFLHVREIRRDITHWQRWWEEAGLQAVALFDRHAQMDHLENPLWQFPDSKLLAQQALKGHVTSHWEIYLRPQLQTPTHQLQTPTHTHTQFQTLTFSRLQKLSGFYPKLWDEYEELSELSYLQKIRLWHGYFARNHRFLPSSTPALQRLARLGILLPFSCPEHLKERCLAPMETEAKDPFAHPTTDSNIQSKAALDWWQHWIYGRNLPLKTKAVELGQKIIIRLLSL